ncbi:hypothetical protein PoB_007558500 [Plakobranchus ocellatus]|uniref:Uncharacterized protein n=1 Tax=Plakobranchus ocellatus TaxID=259542 RepID=A0AAV4DYD9_9GAST|nr:hypothetical protein PoB_007558500 [Plakobranchus ocellatus]
MVFTFGQGCKIRVSKRYWKFNLRPVRRLTPAPELPGAYKQSSSRSAPGVAASSSSSSPSSGAQQQPTTTQFQSSSPAHAQQQSQSQTASSSSSSSAAVHHSNSSNSSSNNNKDNANLISGSSSSSAGNSGSGITRGSNGRSSLPTSAVGDRGRLHQNQQPQGPGLSGSSGRPSSTGASTSGKGEYQGSGQGKTTADG